MDSRAERGGALRHVHAPEPPAAGDDGGSFLSAAGGASSFFGAALPFPSASWAATAAEPSPSEGSRLERPSALSVAAASSAAADKGKEEENEQLVRPHPLLPPLIPGPPLVALLDSCLGRNPCR